MAKKKGRTVEISGGRPPAVHTRVLKYYVHIVLQMTNAGMLADGRTDAVFCTAQIRQSLIARARSLFARNDNASSEVGLKRSCPFENLPT